MSSAAPRTGSTDADWKARRLKATHLFGELDADTLTLLAQSCTERSLEPGEVLLEEGSLGRELFVVISGALRVTQGTTLLGEVRKGEHVGERALLDKAPRMATATAISATRVLSLSADAVEQSFSKKPALKHALQALFEHRQRWAQARRLRPPPEQMMEELGRFIPDLPRHVLDAVADEVEWVTLPRGATLFRQGEPGDALYFVVRGLLKVFTGRDDGREVRLGEVGPGESIGEMAVLSGDVRMASARAEADGELLKLTRAGFDTVLSLHPRALAVFARTMADRLSRASRSRAAVAQLKSSPFVTLQECEETVATKDVVMLNLKITQMYHRIAVDLTVLLGAQDVNWFGFACRASKSAGRAIRQEDFPLRDTLEQLGLWKYAAAVGSRLVNNPLGRRVDRTLDEVSDKIAQGNRLIFSEIGPVFVRLVQACANEPRYDHERLEQVLAALKSGPPEAGGQDMLKDACRAWYAAAYETHPKKRAELVLLGSMKIGLHEQIRVDPLIVEALESPVRVFVDEILESNLVGRLPGAKLATRRLRAALAARVRQELTRRMMRVRLPYGEVSVGEDVPDLPGRRRYPDLLQDLEHPELRSLFERLAGGDNARAIDWSSLSDRMRYICTLFRSRQKSLELFEPPYFFAQASEILVNRVPTGAL